MTTAQNKSARPANVEGGPQPRALIAAEKRDMTESAEIHKVQATTAVGPTTAAVALLTAGRDRPYALGLATALVAQGIPIDIIGSDDTDCPEWHGNPLVNFLNLRDQQDNAGLIKKMVRVLAYYFRLMRYTAVTPAKILHILWNNKFEYFDRTLLMFYYKCLGKMIVLTVHNVNAGQRDANDSFLNRLTLKIQYRWCNHIFVHTRKMKAELTSQFGVVDARVSVIPFGINNTVPNTELTTGAAKRKFGIREGEKTLLFFGNIAPYKGLEYLVKAFLELSKESVDYRLMIIGRPKHDEDYWRGLEQLVLSSGNSDRVIRRIEYVPYEETEWFFKAADVLVLPYVEVFQSGVLFLGYSFGLPVLAADVGSLKEEIVEGQTGSTFEARNSAALAKAVRTYFTGDLFRNLPRNRETIRDFANERYSWTRVGETTKSIYATL
jgi:glycosyltransferase involved in cell wall biosynthesis